MRLLICALSVLVLCLAGFVPLAVRSRGHAQQPVASVLVIDGGTLIDGNGAAPVRDVQIVVEGNRIRSIGRKGQNHPADAQVLNADGKFILPGLWDGLVNYLWYQGEVLLNNGITSYMGIGDMGEVGVVYAEGIKRGKIRAPRPFDWPVHFQWPAGTTARSAGKNEQGPTATLALLAFLAF